MKDFRSPSGAEESLFFLSGILEETLKLLLDAHEYFEHYGRADQDRLAMSHRILYSREMTRITMRLSCVMAWLMAQKAVAGGQLSQQQAAERHRLDCADACLVRTPEAETLLPSPMNQLLSNSYNLYSRVHRLDTQMASAADTRH